MTHTTHTAATAVDVGGVVNGLEDLDWDAVHWRRTEDEVRRLRQRIFKASQAGDLKRVRNLQKLMLRSHANTLVSVRQVTERNAGRATAGIDGRVALTAHDRVRLVEQLHQAVPGQVLPVKRVYIPKKGGKLRPLGIPVIADRAQQARVRNALEPEWEARFEPRSYGFRPGRSCHDAIVAIHQALNGPDCRRVWVLDADLASAFDKIDHSHLLDQLGWFPARAQVRAWLKAGIVDKGRYAPTEEGTPQGGVASPLLLNIALHGMEQAAGVRYRPAHGINVAARHASPVLIRYADDAVALCHSRQQAEQVQQRLAQWLAPRGLKLNEAKTQIVHASDGFDFLGFNVRRYHTGQGGKLLIKPSKDAMARMRQRLSSEVRALRGADPLEVIGRLNPVIRGWAAYYRPSVASDAFRRLDNHLWPLLYKWARRRHPRKSRHWAVARYFGQFNKARQDRWVFGDRDSGAYLHRFAWTKIVRHPLVTGAASPDDPALAHYWADRRRKRLPQMSILTMRLIRAQQGRCSICQEYLLHADQEPQSPREWEKWFAAIGKAMTRQLIVSPPHGRQDERRRLVHTSCLRRQPADDGEGPASQRNASTPQRPA